MLLGAGFLLAALTLIWVRLDTGISPPSDSGYHLLRSLLFARTIDLGGPGALWETIRASYVGWPPVSHVVHGLLGWIVSEQSQSMRSYSLVFLPPLLWGTYRLGLALVDRRAAVLAAVATVFTVGIAGQLRQVSIDLPATAAVLLTLVALVRWQQLARHRELLWVGAACGLALATRVQAAFFLVGPLLLVIGRALWRASRRERLALLPWLLGGLALAALVSSPWWAGKLGDLWWASTRHLDPAKVTPRGDPGLAYGLYYYTGALGKLAGWPVLIVVLGMIPLALRRRLPGTALLGLCIAGGIVGCALGVHREPRYLLPAVPAAVLLAVAGLQAVTAERRVRHLLGAGLLLWIVVPTLLVAAFPLIPRHPLVRRGVLEWAYVRRPVHIQEQAAAHDALRALAVDLGRDPAQERIYLLLAQQTRINFLPHMACFMVPALPQTLFGYTSRLPIANTSWHREERRRRTMFVLSERAEKMDLPLVWIAPKGRFRNRTPIRLYRVPPGHPMLRRLDHRKQIGPIL